MINNVYAIVVTYNAEKWIDKCFGSLALSETPVHTIVVDNCSTDRTIQILKEKYPRVDLITSTINLGFGKANNIGLKLAIEKGADYCLLLNQDATILPDTLQKLIHAHIGNQEYGILSPVHYSSENNIDCNHLTTVSKCSSLVNDLIVSDVKEIYNIGYTNAAIWLLTRSCLKKVGGFDPIFFHYGEDNEYAQRANYMGLKVGLCTAAKAYHFQKQNWNSPLKNYYESTLNKAFIDIKNLDESFINIFWSVTLNVILRMVKSLLKFNFVNAMYELKIYFKLLSHCRILHNSRKINLTTDYSFFN